MNSNQENKKCILQVNDVSKSFINFRLQDINLFLDKGQILGYIGPNGAGKTTTIKIITNQYKPDKGAVYVNGYTIECSEIDFKKSIGYIADQFLFPDFFKIYTIEKILEDFYDSFDKQMFYSYIHSWKLPVNQKVGTFSKGMKARLMFASVLSRKPKLLILDEATSGLDPVLREEMLQILKDYVKDGEHSVLLSTHILYEVEAIADWICIIDKGICVVSGAKDHILNSYWIITGSMKDLPYFQKECEYIYENNCELRGLIKDTQIKGIPKGIKRKKANLEEIVFFYSKRGYKYDKST
ncbi:MAG: ABC transporter ATP-binding protein [[Clostridium] scindens]|uniref:ABC transporter ATP-binding protein n=2 Tax=Clostridium scindens (strain JCM 10418 / VPI 12708) TaxID=29347 RepID=UPI0004BA8FC5|nr:ABC transporter ATP-binding protein [[Clostridium] scindens]MBS6805702.1 ABC transporter ATP-binding protein [Lachnospiraceae bacterium]MCB6890401.1 ABC transporter ATP-binding protein [[Clostridium] scindens]NSJ15052.1 ABC transporter ATP-binding protein [[Clostridium] scindens]WPB27317.1 Vitamin B12 import ATP-binding protein BtuD [[Clostridium] scindens]WPB49055.1 Vitamin B12 import ATP-binding protein BtuD [[Clostridium] scindens]